MFSQWVFQTNMIEKRKRCPWQLLFRQIQIAPLTLQQHINFLSGWIFTGRNWMSGRKKKIWLIFQRMSGKYSQLLNIDISDTPNVGCRYNHIYTYVHRRAERATAPPHAPTYLLSLRKMGEISTKPTFLFVTRQRGIYYTAVLNHSTGSIVLAEECLANKWSMFVSFTTQYI